MPGTPQKAVLVISCLGPRNDDSVVLICANWFMTCSLTEERWETVLGLITEGCIVVPDHMLIPILFMSVDPVDPAVCQSSRCICSQGHGLEVKHLLGVLHLF